MDVEHFEEKPKNQQDVNKPKSTPASQGGSCQEPPILVVTTEPCIQGPKSSTSSMATMTTIHRRREQKGVDLFDMANLQVCMFASFIGIGIFLFVTGLILTCVGYSTTPYSSLEVIVIRGHRAGGPLLMGFGCALLAYGLICCIYSRRPPLPRRPPPPNVQRPPRTSITGMGSVTVVKGPPMQKEPTNFRRRSSITLPEPEETTGLPESHVNVVLDLDKPDEK